MARVFLAFGSNKGDRLMMIHRAIELLKNKEIVLQRLSSIMETAPEGGPPGQGLFFNAVGRFKTTLSPQELLKVTLSIEEHLGRVRLEPNGERTIDIDILLYDNLALNEPDLVIPHPRMHERSFVMDPLAEIEAALAARMREGKALS